MQRNCPVCHENLNTSEKFFCGTCGNQLEDSLILRNSDAKKIIDLSRSPKEIHVLPKHYMEAFKNAINYLNPVSVLIILSAILFIGIPSFYTLKGFDKDLLSWVQYNMNSSNTSSATSIPVAPKPVDPNTAQLGLQMKPATLGANMLMSYIPYKTDVLLESNDFAKLSGFFVTDYKDYANFIDQINLLKTESFLGMIQVGGSSPSWALLIPYSDKTEETKINGLISEAKNYESIKVATVNNNLIVSNSEVLLKDIDETYKGVQKSINMNPSFVALKSKIQKNGQLLLISLTGEGFDYLKKYSEGDSPDVYKKIIGSYLQNKSNYLIVN